MEVTKVSEESLQKALQTLGLVKAEVVDKSIEDAAKIKEQEELKKAEETKAIETELADTLKKAEDLKAKLSGETKASEAVAVTTSTENSSTTVTVDNSEIIKSFESKVLALGTVIQSKDEQLAELKKAVDGVTTFNAELAKRLGMIANQPVDRKSVATSQVIERFAIEKGGDAGTRTLSLSDRKQRAELSDMLYKAAVSGNEIKDQEFAKAVPYIELQSLGSNQSEAQSLSQRIKKEFNIVVTK